MISLFSSVSYLSLSSSWFLCSICLEQFEGREMPCKHRFHSACIKNWFQIRRLCPLCRFIMPLVLEEEEEDWQSIIQYAVDHQQEGRGSIDVVSIDMWWWLGPSGSSPIGLFGISARIVFKLILIGIWVQIGFGSWFSYGYEIYFEDDSVMDMDLG